MFSLKSALTTMCVVAAVILAFAPRYVASAAPPTNPWFQSAPQHCVVRFGGFSRICFSSFNQAIAVANNRAPIPGLNAQNYNPAVLRALGYTSASAAPKGTFYKESHFNGNSVTLSGAGGTCRDGKSFTMEDLSVYGYAGWQYHVRSAKADSVCQRFMLYQSVNPPQKMPGRDCGGAGCDDLRNGCSYMVVKAVRFE